MKTETQSFALRDSDKAVLQQAASLARGPAPPRPARQPRPGSSWPRRKDVAERYELIRELGRGRFGAVHLARDKKTGEQVALKSLFKMQPGEVAALQNEAAALIRATKNKCPQGPPIIACYRDHFVVEGDDGKVNQVYLVMDYVPGRSLFQQPPMLRSMSSKALLQSALQGLAFLHRQGVAHRDIKPANIVTFAPDPSTPTIRAALVDLGMACTDDKICDESFVNGDIYYQAPERLQDFVRDWGDAVAKNYRPPKLRTRRGVQFYQKADVYALGLALTNALLNREVLSRKPLPRPGEPAGKVLLDYAIKHLSEQQRLGTPRFPPGALPDSVVHVLRNMMEINPRKRWSAEQAYNYLARFANK